MATSNSQGSMNQGNSGFLGLGFGGSAPTYTPGAYNNSALDGLINNPGAGANAAVSNPYLSGILGPNGTLQSAENQASQLQATGYNLQPQDYTAYGDASNQAARTFGQQGSSLASMLAQRGMGTGGGASGAAFTGLQGNKNEQLMAAQGNIATARMNFAQSALNNTRNSISQMAGVGNQATGMYNQQQEAAASGYDNAYKTQNNAGYMAADQQANAQSPTLLQTIGGGIAGTIAGSFQGAGSAGAKKLGSAVNSLGGGSAASEAGEAA